MAKENYSVFIHRLLKSLADSIIKVFIPLYILKTTQNTLLAFGYLTFYAFFTLILNIVLKKFIEKYCVIAVIIHFIPIIIAEGILNFFAFDISALILSAFLMALSQVFYSVPINILFTLKDKTINVAKFQIATNIGKMVFTLLSGLFLFSNVKNSFLLLSIFSSVLYVISSVFVFTDKKTLKEKYDDANNAKKTSNYLEITKKFNLFHVSFGLFQVVMDDVLPIYLYVNNLSFETITIVIVVIELCKVGTNSLAGLLLRRNKEKVCLLTSVIVYVISIIIIAFIKDKVAIFILVSLCSVTFPLTFVPMFRKYCQTLNGSQDLFDGMLTRDVCIFSLRPALYAVYFIGLSVYPIFAVAVINAVVMRISERKIEEQAV